MPRKKKKLGWKKRVPIFEVGDLVVAHEEYEGVVESLATIISKNGFGTKRRLYHVRLLDPHPLGPKYMSTDGRHMTRLDEAAEVLGEEYFW